MSKPKTVLCRICLRTDLVTRDIREALADFHDEITEYAIYQNNALKYCSVCEHLLLKFYNFTQQCRRANKILKSSKKINGRYPNNLHELLLPSPLTCSIQPTFQYNINDISEPWNDHLVIIKEEKIEDELLNDIKVCDNSDMLETQDDLKENDSSYVVRTLDLADILNDKQQEMKTAELADINLVNEIVEDNENPLSLLKIQSNFEEVQNNEDQNTNEVGVKVEVKLEDYSSDVQVDNYNEDSSDTELINKLEKQIQVKRKPRQRKRGTSVGRPKPPLHNRKELEKVFEIHEFATELEAKKELELRKTSEQYLTAKNKCELCYIHCHHSKQLEIHMKMHNPSAGDYECSVCRLRFHYKKDVNNHKSNAHYGKFKCKECPFITYHKLGMKKHYQRHSGNLFKCQHCNRTFTQASTYKSHVSLRHVTDHVCVTCAETFVTKKGLALHRSIKHKTQSKVDNDATAHCEPCGLTFANEQVYTVHIMNADKHVDLAKSIIACKVCGLRFENKQDLFNHRRSTHPHRYYKSVKVWTRISKDNTCSCSICGAVGSTKSWMYNHIASVHPDSPYVADLARRRQHMCETCGKCYTSIYTLRDHINTHTGIKPFHCPKCPASFPSRTRLMFHMEWHGSAKRECKQCGKKFVSASNLSNHMRSHIQDRRYKCSICHKGFIHSSMLRAHVRGVHHNVRRVRKQVKRETVACES